MTQTMPTLSEAAPTTETGTETVLPPVWRLRAVRQHTQRLTDEIEAIAAGAARPGPDVIRGAFGTAVRDKYDTDLIPQAGDMLRRSYAQLRRLRAAEAAARGVPVTAVDAWITDDDEHLVRGQE